MAGCRVWPGFYWLHADTVGYMRMNDKLMVTICTNHTKYTDDATRYESKAKNEQAFAIRLWPTRPLCRFGDSRGKIGVYNCS